MCCPYAYVLSGKPFVAVTVSETQIVLFNRPDLYHKSSDSGELQYKLRI